MIDLHARLAEDRILLAPGIYDALTGLVAERAGAEAVYLSGASIAYTRFGRPDIGLVTMTEVAEVIAAIRDRIAIPMLVDADTGYGNALNVQRTVRTFERMGANVIQLEDQTLPKRCGHLAGKTLVPMTEMTGKIHAALDARASDATLIMARTDAIAVEGIDAALDRAEAYAQAGADILFVEAPQDDAQIAAIMERLRADACRCSPIWSRAARPRSDRLTNFRNSAIPSPSSRVVPCAPSRHRPSATMPEPDRDGVQRGSRQPDARLWRPEQP